MSRNNNYGSQDTSKFWLFGFGAVLVIAFVLYRHHKPATVAGGQMPGADGASVDGVKTKADKYGVMPGYHSVTAESRYLLDIPWNEFRMADNGSLRIEMEPRKWCTTGDLDVIAFDGKKTDNPKFLMTVEPLNFDDASFAPIVHQLTTAELTHGFRFSFKLPSLKKGQQAGIFVCKDSSATGRCNTESREVIDLNRALAENREKGEKDKNFKAPDRIYYFQYLYLTENNKVASFMNPEVPDITFDAVNERLKKSDLSAKELEDQQHALGRAKRLQQTLRSLPLEQGQGFARIVMPQMDGDPKHCPQVAKAANQQK